MNEEIEIRVKLKNPKEAEKKLSSKAKFVEKIDQKDEYYVPAHRDFFEEDPTSRYLRIRFEEGRNEIGFHVCHYEDGEMVSADEYETEVEDPEEMREILKGLGMKNKVTVKKRRKVFETENHEIVIDQVEDLGCFMEIEVKKRTKTKRKAKKGCFKLLKELDLQHKRIPEGGYCDKLLDKRN